MRGIEPNNKRNVVFPSSVLPSQCFGNPPSPEGEGLIGCVHDCHLVALVEKSPAAETVRNIHAPAHLPAVAYRRESPYNRNDDTRTRITDQANTLNAAVIARSVATWQSPGRENLLAYTDKILARGGSPSRTPAAETERYVPAPAHLPAVARRREIPRGRNGTLRTRASQMPARAPCRASPLARRGTLPFYRNSSERRDSTLGARKSAFTAPSSRTIAREAT